MRCPLDTTVPDPPEDLRAIATSSSELVIEWQPPNNPNGIVTYYIVRGIWGGDDQDYVDKQDSCADRESLISLSFAFTHSFIHSIRVLFMLLPQSRTSSTRRRATRKKRP